MVMKRMVTAFMIIGFAAVVAGGAAVPKKSDLDTQPIGAPPPPAPLDTQPIGAPPPPPPTSGS